MNAIHRQSNRYRQQLFTVIVLLLLQVLITRPTISFAIAVVPNDTVPDTNTNTFTLGQCILSLLHYDSNADEVISRNEFQSIVNFVCTGSDSGAISRNSNNSSSNDTATWDSVFASTSCICRLYDDDDDCCEDNSKTSRPSKKKPKKNDEDNNSTISTSSVIYRTDYSGSNYTIAICDHLHSAFIEQQCIPENDSVDDDHSPTPPPSLLLTPTLASILSRVVPTSPTTISTFPTVAPSVLPDLPIPMLRVPTSPSTTTSTSANRSGLTASMIALVFVTLGATVIGLNVVRRRRNQSKQDKEMKDPPELVLDATDDDNEHNAVDTDDGSDQGHTHRSNTTNNSNQRLSLWLSLFSCKKHATTNDDSNRNHRYNDNNNKQQKSPTAVIPEAQIERLQNHEIQNTTSTKSSVSTVLSDNYDSAVAMASPLVTNDNCFLLSNASDDESCTRSEKGRFTTSLPDNEPKRINIADEPTCKKNHHVHTPKTLATQQTDSVVTPLDLQSVVSKELYPVGSESDNSEPRERNNSDEESQDTLLIKINDDADARMNATMETNDLMFTGKSVVVPNSFHSYDDMHAESSLRTSNMVVTTTSSIAVDDVLNDKTIYVTQSVSNSNFHDNHGRNLNVNETTERIHYHTINNRNRNELDVISDSSDSSVSS